MVNGKQPVNCFRSNQMTDTIILRKESTVILLTLRTKGTAYSSDLSITYFLGECVCGLVKIVAVKPPSQ